MKRRFVGAIALLGLIAATLVVTLNNPKSTLLLSNARAEVEISNADTLLVFASLSNGSMPDKLIGASSDLGVNSELVTFTGSDAVPIPANSTPVLSADGAFVRVSGIEEIPAEGQLIPITFVFEKAGHLTTKAVIAPPSDPHAVHRAMGHVIDEDLLAEGQSAPQAELAVTRNAQGGWDVQLATQNFTFDGQTEEPVHVPGHGHGHLYINGLKLQRMYGPSAEIGQLPPSVYEIRVSLNTNDHRPYLNDGQPVQVQVQIEVD